MPVGVIPLIDMLVEVPDFRMAQGKRYSLAAILALACAAMLCGYRSYSALAEWGRNYGATLVQALGFRNGETPCAATLHTIFRHLDVGQFEACVSCWVEQVLTAYPTEQAVACDGKTLRGSRKLGAPGAHLLAAVSQRLGLTMAQCAVPDKSNELAAITVILQALVLEGRIVTVDALHTHRNVAETIITQGGDYIMYVKDNQPQLREDIVTLFAEPQVVAETLTTSQCVDAGHGRIEWRRLTASSALVDYTPWPGLQQVFQLERSITNKKTGRQRHETVYGVTSLTPQQADATRLLRLTRQHWSIENRLHWVRDVTFDEDRSTVRCGHIPQVMALLRNTTISLLRLAGHANIAAAHRHYAANPWAALAIIGITAEN